MKIKMYTKVTCYPLNGTPYKKIIWATYDSIDDINIVDGEDKITSVDAGEDEETVRTYKKNAKITRYPFLGGRIQQLGYNTFIAVDPVELIELMIDKIIIRRYMAMYDLFNSIIIEGQKRNNVGCVSFENVSKEDVLKILHFYFSGDWEAFLSGLSEVWKHNAHFLVKEAWECVFQRNISLEEIKNYKAE